MVKLPLAPAESVHPFAPVPVRVHVPVTIPFESWVPVVPFSVPVTLPFKVSTLPLALTERVNVPVT